MVFNKADGASSPSNITKSSVILNNSDEIIRILNENSKLKAYNSQLIESNKLLKSRKEDVR